MEHISFKDGGIRELWKVSLPLMFSWLSIVSMSFVDRLYLAHYSLDALNATVTSGLFAWAFTYFVQVMCEMCEVFVAQYNGSKNYRMMGKPVWQMFQFSIVSTLFFAPLAYYGTDYLFPETEQGYLQGTYFRWLVAFGPAFALVGALSSYFIGQGKSYVYTYVVIIGNVVNIVLDPILIFGIDGWVPETGVKGAAVATGLGTLIQAVILYYLFRQHEKKLAPEGTLWQFDKDIFIKCIRLGLPMALFMFMEIGGWALYYSMMSYASNLHILVAGISQSILFLFAFFGIGLSRGISAVGGNLIGAGLRDRLPNLLKSSFILIGIYFLITCIPMIFFPDMAINLFIKNPEHFDVPVSWDNVDINQIKSLLRFGLVISCFYLLFDNIQFIYKGILTSAGDTYFLMWSGLLTLWAVMVIPTYYLVVHLKVSIEIALGIWVLYSILACVAPLLRYLYGDWKEKNLISPESA